MEENLYPTKDEILNNIKEPSQEEKEKVEKWKKENYYQKWKNATKEEKIEALKNLTKLLINKKENYDVKITNKWYILLSTKDNSIKEIGIDENNLSIISCLHEIGHAIYGHKELDACTYSTGIFLHCFPKEFIRLSWEGHMLVKR